MLSFGGVVVGKIAPSGPLHCWSVSLKGNYLHTCIPAPLTETQIVRGSQLWEEPMGVQLIPSTSQALPPKLVRVGASKGPAFLCDNSHVTRAPK